MRDICGQFVGSRAKFVLSFVYLFTIGKIYICLVILYLYLFIRTICLTIVHACMRVRILCQPIQNMYLNNLSFTRDLV